MWFNAIANLILLLLEYWVSKAPQREQRNEDKKRTDVLHHDVDAVTERIDRLLKKARDSRATRV